ncbi:MAG: hypothetical protein ACI9P7_000911 [Candidatus Azotimanducaceae bacterium]|jgi:hypothetical protein
MGAKALETKNKDGANTFTLHANAIAISPTNIE